nr:beta-amyrin 28-oxidase [Ipomoea trifida]
MEPILIGACIILATFLILSATGFIQISKGKKRSRNLPPGSYGWPVIGESLEFLRRNREGKPEKFVTDRMSKYKSEVFKTCLLGEPVVVLSGPAGNKFLYSNGNKLVTTWWPTSVQKLLGTCLTTSVGDEAKQMKKLMSYFVSPDALEKLYIKNMDFVTQQHIKNHWQGKEELKVLPAVKLYTFELACRFFISVEDPEQIKKLCRLFNIFLKGIISLPLNIPGARFHRAMRATALIREELLRINGSFMSELHIVNNIIMLLFAGHDTSSVTITLLIKTLGDLPHVYEKVLQEHREIAATKEDGEFLHWDDIQKMKYSWNVVCEVMRQYSPVIGAFREALFYWNAPITHMNASFFPSPKEFDPSRFEGDGAVPYTFVPFGGGPRMCLGKEFARLEILTFLHNVVKRFRWSLVVPDERLEYDPMPIPVEGLPVRLHPHKL